MIFINLLPDIKLEYARSLRIKRLLVLLSAILITCCIIISSVLYFVTSIQQTATIEEIEGTDEVIETDPNKDPNNKALIAEIKAREDIQDILTIQNQLKTLPDLRKDRIAADRLFEDEDEADDLAFLDILIPKDATEDVNVVENITFDFVDNSFVISGKTVDEKSAKVIHETIRFIGIEECRLDNLDTRIYPFRVGADIDTPSASTENNDPISFSIMGTFSAKLFDDRFNEKDLVLVVPDELVGKARIFQPDHNCGEPPTELDKRLDPLAKSVAEQAVTTIKEAGIRPWTI